MAKTRESIVSDREPRPHERIAQRAYELYELRGRQDGFDLQDWLQAEQDILRDRSQLEQSATAEVEESQGQSKVSAKQTR